MSASAEVLDLTVTELAAQIRAGRLSSADLTEACLDRIRRLSPRLNAFQTVTESLAREQARQADAEIRGGHWRGPLHGIP